MGSHAESIESYGDGENTASRHLEIVDSAEGENQAAKISPEDVMPIIIRDAAYDDLPDNAEELISTIKTNLAGVKDETQERTVTETLWHLIERCGIATPEDRSSFDFLTKLSLKIDEQNEHFGDKRRSFNNKLFDLAEDLENDSHVLVHLVQEAIDSVPRDDHKSISKIGLLMRRVLLMAYLERDWHQQTP